MPRRSLLALLLAAGLGAQQLTLDDLRKCTRNLRVTSVPELSDERAGKPAPPYPKLFNLKPGTEGWISLVVSVGGKLFVYGGERVTKGPSNGDDSSYSEMLGETTNHVKRVKDGVLLDCSPAPYVVTFKELYSPTSFLKVVGTFHSPKAP